MSSIERKGLSMNLTLRPVPHAVVGVVAGGFAACHNAYPAVGTAVEI
ncbi:MAG: hypothetical protein VKJ85_01565 [Prochlorothrix sp.]|nr:hypothetical protein [Prochlorothrix sp.]